MWVGCDCPCDWRGQPTLEGEREGGKERERGEVERKGEREVGGLKVNTPVILFFYFLYFFVGAAERDQFLGWEMTASTTLTCR